MTDNFDYIVIGAGSAGSVLANRLSGSATVCVLEARPSANANASTLMIAEKAADMILGQPPLRSANLNSTTSEMDP